VANDGSLRADLESQVHAAGLGERVRFVGRLSPDEQARWYGAARWYLSQPESDSVSVSVLEAMAHGCVPVLSDLAANRELVDDGRNGLIVGGNEGGLVQRLDALLPRADALAAANREWVAEHALFAPAVVRFLARLEAIHTHGEPQR
jgi:glycosyltransferase involved in cell wall biosynthesis